MPPLSPSQQRKLEDKHIPNKLKTATFYSAMFTEASKFQNIAFFSSVTGGKKYTNIQQVGQLPEGWDFMARSFWLKIFNASGKPFYVEGGSGSGFPKPFIPAAIMADGYFEITRENGSILEFQGHLSQLMNSMVVLNSGVPQSAGPQTLITIGTHMLSIGQSRGRISFRNKILIPGGKNFRVDLGITTPAEGGGYTAADTMIMVGFDGDLERK